MEGLGPVLEVSYSSIESTMAIILTESFLSGFCAYRSRIYRRPSSTAFPPHTITSRPEGRAHRDGEADYDSSASIHGRLHSRLGF